MQINDNSKGWQQGIPNKKQEYGDDDIQRDLELENIASNLMNAEYQLHKLEQRLSQHVRDIGYRSFNEMKTSAHTFKYGGKWYKLSIKVEELSLNSSSSSGNNNSVGRRK